MLRVVVSFTFIAAIFFKSAIFAQSESPRFAFCKSLAVSDVLESCELISILETQKNVIKAYGLSSKRFLSLSQEDVFEVKQTSESRPNAGEKVLIPSQLLSNQSTEQSFQVCQTVRFLGNQLYQVECGQERRLKVHAKFLFQAENSFYSKKYPGT